MASVGVSSFIWLRGRAERYDRRKVALDWYKHQKYDLFDYHPAEVGLRLANVSPVSVSGFVREFGLLWHGPNAALWDEDWRDWGEVIGAVREALGQYLYLRPLLEEEGSTLDARLSEGRPQGIARALNPYLEGTGVIAFPVEMEGRDGGPPGLEMRPRPFHLCGYACFGVLQLIHESWPLRQCEGCEAFFRLRDARQRHCSETCANRVRQRRWRARNT